MEKETQMLDRNGVMRSRKLFEWEVTAAGNPAQYGVPEKNARLVRQISIIFEPNEASALATMTETVYETPGQPGVPTDEGYFAALNARETKTYHFVAVSNKTTAQGASPANAAGWFSGQAAATTSLTEYEYDANYKARGVVGMAKKTSLKDASGAVKAKSEIFYDEAFYLEGVTVTGLAGWENPQTSVRGLPTTIRSWTDVSGNLFIDAHTRYDQFGNAIKTYDGKGNYSEIHYADNYTDYIKRNSYALPTKTVSFSGANGGGTRLETTVQYDFNTGLPRFTTDVNNQVAELQYDALLRPVKTIAPNGHQTITEYGVPDTDGKLLEGQRFVKVRTQIDETRWKEGYTFFDGIGRTKKTQSVDSDGDVFTETKYDDYGRLWKTSNPYRANETIFWTENFYDTASRLLKVKTPDNAEVETFYSLATTGNQLGTVVTVEDQANKQRRSITNALGQLTRVDEPTTVGLGAINAPTQPTLYSYDALNNLVQVVQNGSGTEQCGTNISCSQTRTFTYDALSRLKSATNPEMGTASTSGTITYSYDANGNLTKKTDPRGVVTDYTYDALNRVTTRTYTAPAGLANYAAAPAVNYYYDGTYLNEQNQKLTVSGNAKGKLTSVSTNISRTNYTAFDTMGRVTQSQQMTDGVTYPTMTYAYNLSGALIEQKYPSGRVVKNEFDADGDLSVVKSKKSETAGYWNYAQHFTYTAAGAVKSMQLGNGTWESTQFNNRLQPTQIALGSIQNASNKLKLNFDYGTTANNGNVLSQTITVPTETRNGTTYNGFTATQTYTYDSLNRLKSAAETIGSQTWKQTFKYDLYGNRRFDTTNNNTTTLEAGCAEAVCNPQIDVARNRLIGTSYDNAGNTTADAANKTFIYDGENKQIEVKNPLGQTIGQYFYDGDGKRVKKYVSSTGETTIFIYDASGKMVAEYSTTVAPASQAKISYLTTDHLGNPRINTDANGAVTARHDYRPFGEEITRASYGADNVKQKFTGYERDIESDLDYAQARYYNFKHGRFTSVDPLMASADIVNPQTFNRYIYVGNNPVNITDPTGEIWGSKDGTVQWFDTEDAMKAAGFTAYTLLYAFRTGTNQMVALNANANVAVNVASAAAWLSQQVSWGATAQMLAPGAAALAGIPVAAAALALADVLDPAGRYRTRLNMPEPAREWAGTKQSYWDEFMTAMSKAKSNESSPPSANTQGETSPATPDPNDNRPNQQNNRSNTSSGQTTREAAAALGYNRRIPANRAPFNSHRQTVYSNGRTYITRDVDSHRGGVWKIFDRRGRRLGTYDANLNRIGN